MPEASRLEGRLGKGVIKMQWHFADDQAEANDVVERHHLVQMDFQIEHNLTH